ncbi:MAG TPA: hypothetical protein VLE73_02805 [Candidatus Saccharimonadales bacterium]|nr:hypothetical protein [Candidatus Saccharimonadales bacterium]
MKRLIGNTLALSMALACDAASAPAETRPTQPEYVQFDGGALGGAAVRHADVLLQQPSLTSMYIDGGTRLPRPTEDPSGNVTEVIIFPAQ